MEIMDNTITGSNTATWTITTWDSITTTIDNNIYYDNTDYKTTWRDTWDIGQLQFIPPEESNGLKGKIFIDEIQHIKPTPRILTTKEKLSKERYLDF